MYNTARPNQWQPARITLSGYPTSHNLQSGDKSMNKQRHGFSYHKLYSVYKNMTQRTSNILHKSFNDYGGRGITVCDEWKSNKKSFFEWAISSGYKEGLTLDRRDNDKGYSPDNCRWVTQTIQTRNTRVIHKHNTSGYRGVGWHKARGMWRAYIKIKGVSKHIGHYKTAIEASEAYNNFIVTNNLEHTINTKRG